MDIVEIYRMGTLLGIVPNNDYSNDLMFERVNKAGVRFVYIFLKI